MFSSPSRGSVRRKTGSRAPESVRSSVYEGRASTPLATRHTGRRRQDSIVSADVTVDDSKSVTRPFERRQKGSREQIQEGTILSRDDLYAVTAYCRLPVEVVSAVQDLGTYDPCRSELDTQTGYAYLVTSTSCFIWSFASRGSQSPPCYIIPLTKSSSSRSSLTSPTLPYCSFIARGNNREPGLILIDPSGQVVFSDNVVSSLSNERMTRQSILLGSGEIVTCLHRCGRNMFLAATSQARLFSIGFTSTGGGLQVQMAPFAQSKGLFGRIFGTNSQLSLDNSTVGVASCLASDESGAYEVYVLGTSTLQKWSIVEGGGEKLLIEEDIRGTLVEKSGGADSTQASQMLDIAMTSAGSPAILFSDAQNSDGLLRYQVAFIEMKPSVPSFVVSSSIALTYTRYPDSRPCQQSRLVIPYGGPIFYVVFAEAILFRLTHGDHLEEMIEMREVATNPIIGFGAEHCDIERPASLSNLTVVTAKTGALLVEVDTDRAQHLDMQLAHDTQRNEIFTHQLKSKIERAIFHSDQEMNPVSFDLPLETQGNIMAAVAQLSEQIVLSQSPGLTNSVDLRLQLADRLEKLHRLAFFIASNGKLGLFSQNALRKLSADAELIAAAVDIWEYYNTSLSMDANQGRATDSLAAAINVILSGHPDAQWEGDLIRLFFRQELIFLNEVLANLQIDADTKGVTLQTTKLIRVNQIILSAFQAAQRYRAETAELYNLDYQHVSYEAWTCKMSNIRALQRQIQVTSEVLQFIKRGISEVPDDSNGTTKNDSIDGLPRQEILRGQLCELVAGVLDLFEERIDYLQVAGGANPSLEKEGRLLQEEYIITRSQIILSLVTCDRSDRAFYLAEKHKDYQVLTTLCSSLHGTAQETRIRSYLNKYGKAFAFELYQFYIREGQLTKLLEVEEEYHQLLGSFLQSREEYNRLAWLHEVNLIEWSQATDRLQIEANREASSVESKKLILSLRKLTFVAQLNEEDVGSAIGQERIELIDDQLDIVNVQNKLRETLQDLSIAQVDGIDLTNALDARTEILAETSPSMKALYSLLASKILNHQVVSCEDLIDLLTLADGNEESIEHFKTAIEVFVRAKDIPSARTMQVLASLWRRIILHDDWLEITDTTLASTSDDVLVAKMKSTALFQVMQSCFENKSTLEVILDPADCLVATTLEALQARFKFEEETFIDGLYQDGEGELERAQQIVTIGIERGWFDDVNRLLKEAQQEAQGNDELMDDQFLTTY